MKLLKLIGVFTFLLFSSAACAHALSPVPRSQSPVEAASLGMGEDDAPFTTLPPTFISQMREALSRPFVREFNRDYAGRWNIDGFLTETSNAVLYRAVKLEGGEVAAHVVVKQIKSPLMAERNYLVQRLLSMIDHPQIIKCFDAGKIGNDAYLILEYVEGVSLDLHLGRTDDFTLSPELIRTRIGWVRQIAQILAALHEHAIVYRDLKPANLILKPDGTLVLIDFELAYIVNNESLAEQFQDIAERQRSSHTPMGTPYYMSPQQFDVQPLDGRSDLWSLGVILYEWIQDERAFHGSVEQIQRKIGEMESPLVITRGPEFHELEKQIQAINKILEKLANPFPELRFESAEELIEALDQFLATLAPSDTMPVWQAELKNPNSGISLTTAHSLGATSRAKQALDRLTSFSPPTHRFTRPGLSLGLSPVNLRAVSTREMRKQLFRSS